MSFQDQRRLPSRNVGAAMAAFGGTGSTGSTRGPERGRRKPDVPMAQARTVAGNGSAGDPTAQTCASSVDGSIATASPSAQG